MDRGTQPTLHPRSELFLSRRFRQRFDAVVVATGRFHAPFIPTIPGLAEWNRQFGERILHSRAYRHPAPYVNETVLIVGAAVGLGHTQAVTTRDLIIPSAST